MFLLFVVIHITVKQIIFFDAIGATLMMIFFLLFIINIILLILTYKKILENKRSSDMTGNTEFINEQER